MPSAKKFLEEKEETRSASAFLGERPTGTVEERIAESQPGIAGAGFEGFAPGGEFRFSDIPQPIRRGAPAAIGALAGGGLAAATGPAFPLSAPLFTAAGGLIGESIAQATGAGGAEFDPLSLLLSAATPPSTRTAVGAARVGTRFAAPGRAATELNRMAVVEAKTAVQALAPAAKAGPLFEIARQQGSQIPASKVLSAARSVLDDVSGMSKGAQKEFSRVVDYAKGIAAKLEETGGVLNPTELQNELHAVGEIASSLHRQGGPGVKFISQIKSSLSASLDDAAKADIPGAATLKEARKTFLREQTVADLAGYIEDATTVRRGLGEAAQFNPNRMLSKLKDDEFYKAAFTAQERKEIESLLKTLNKIPVLPPPGGQTFGSGRIAGRSVLAGGAAGTGFLTGGPEGAAVGAVLGTVIPPLAETARNLALALRMKEGRLLLKTLLAGTDGAVTPEVASALATFAAVQAGLQAEGMDKKALQEIYRDRGIPIELKISAAQGFEPEGLELLRSP